MASEGRLVLLGCGTVGTQALRWLASSGPFRSLLLVDRDGRQAARLAESLAQGRAQVAELDVSDQRGLVRLLQDARMVLNTVGPFFQYGRGALEAAIEARVDYVDVNDDVDSLDQLLSDRSLKTAAQRPGKAYVVGAGTSPGLTAHLARLSAAPLDRLEALHVFLASTISWRGYAVFSHFTHSLGRPGRLYRGGQWVDVPPFSEEESVSFLGVEEPVRCYAAGHPEPVTFPLYFTGVQEVTMKLGRIPNSLLDLFRDLYRYGLMGTEPVEVAGAKVTPADFTAAYLASDAADRIFGFSRATSISAQMVRAVGQQHGRSTVVSCAHTGRSITGQDAAITASLIATGRLSVKGLSGPEALDPGPIMEEILKEGGAFQMEQEGKVLCSGLEDFQALRRNTLQ